MRAGYKFTMAIITIASLFLLAFIQYDLNLALSQDEKPLSVLLIIG
jgi:hypothetical protein